MYVIQNSSGYCEALNNVYLVTTYKLVKAKSTIDGVGAAAMVNAAYIIL